MPSRVGLDEVYHATAGRGTALHRSLDSRHRASAICLAGMTEGRAFIQLWVGGFCFVWWGGVAMEDALMWTMPLLRYSGGSGVQG